MNRDGELPLKDSQKTAFLISASFHAAFLLFLAAQGLFCPPTSHTPKKLVVQSIALKPQVCEKSKAKKTEQQLSLSPPAPQVASLEPEEEEPSQGGKAAKETPLPEEKSSPEEKSAPKEPECEKPSPAEEPVQAIPVKGKPKQESPHKQETRSSPPSKKNPPKQAAKKAVAPTTGGKAKESAKPTQKSTPSKKGMQSKQTSSAPSYDTRLVAEAIDRLNKSHQAAQSGGGGSGGSGHGTSKGGSNQVAHIGSVGALHSDTGVSSTDGVEEGAVSFSETSPEGCYIMDLIRRLKLNIRLSEPGEIRIKLTLKKNGQVDSISVVSCKNEKIKKSLLDKLKTVHFSAFGPSFPGEAEHTFLLRLSNDLSWSCF